MVTHGLDATYKKGCRCQPCKTAQSIANSEKRMLVTGKPPTPGHGRRVIAETCRRCFALHTRIRGIATHVCARRPLGPPKQQRSMSDWRQPGVNTSAWRKVRASVLTRDGHRCRLRLTGCTTQATHVHHIFGRLTTEDDPRYLISACPPCNIRTGNPGLLVELIHLRVHLTRLALDPATPVEPGPAPAYGSPEAKALVRRWVDEHGLSIAHIEETPPS